MLDIEATKSIVARLWRQYGPSKKQPVPSRFLVSVSVVAGNWVNYPESRAFPEILENAFRSHHAIIWHPDNGPQKPDFRVCVDLAVYEEMKGPGSKPTRVYHFKRVQVRNHRNELVTEETGQTQWSTDHEPLPLKAENIAAGVEACHRRSHVSETIEEPSPYRLQL